VGVGFPVRDRVAAPAWLGTGLLGAGRLDTGLLGTVPGVADPEPGAGGAE
jgi:hypothetical protein